MSGRCSTVGSEVGALLGLGLGVGVVLVWLSFSSPRRLPVARTRTGRTRELLDRAEKDLLTAMRQKLDTTRDRP